MRIAIIGAGSVGGSLGRRLADAGHHITFGTRHPADGVKDGAPAGATITTPREAVRDAEVVILAVPWTAATDAVQSLGPLEGRILIDATNPLTRGPDGLALDVGPSGESGAERIAALVPGARVVKAFNTTGANNMADPIYHGERTVMFYAGDDADAKQTVRTLIEQVGFEAVDAGALRRSRELEHVAMLWISLAFGSMGRDFAFRLVRR
jgi:predicted dinucleotide-binding enzyme